jgi:O-antigen/teichoic acid export membrane protein
MVSFICISLTYIYGSLLTAGGKIALLNKISLAGFAINLILNLLLIPKYLALGSAIATVAAQIVSVVCPCNCFGEIVSAYKKLTTMVKKCFVYRHGCWH